MFSLRRFIGSSEALIASLLVIAIALLFGGGSRSDIATHSLVRTVAIVVLAWSLIRGEWPAIRELWFPILLMALWTAMIALQLLPLPPSLWEALPAHAPFQNIFEAVGLGDVWRPLSMSPNATINAFFASLVPFSILVAVARLRGNRPLMIVIVGVLIIAALSALFGIIQITSQAKWAYLYRITNEGAAVGLFANRNHQALFMAATFPLLAVIAAWPGLSTRQRNNNELIALGGAVLLVPLILITGSRAGLVLMVIGALASVVIYRSGQPSLFQSRSASSKSRRGGAKSHLIPLALTAGLIGLVGLTVVFSRAEAVRRLFAEDVSQEIRLRLFSTMLKIGNDFAPFGAGFGTFDPIFRMYEPFETLSPLYVNHAHNDLLEIYIEGGFVALGLLAAFLFWIALRTGSAWRPVSGALRSDQLLARAGSIILLLQLVASLADYPLRTPADAALAAIAVAMLARWPVRPKLLMDANNRHS